ncbi:hypothetical protein [Legionella sp.]|uniref:hypothetical protein n=1 Tax=Legionella sp. TaxID=459 RepID=UPI003CC64D43
MSVHALKIPNAHQLSKALLLKAVSDTAQPKYVARLTVKSIALSGDQCYKLIVSAEYLKNIQTLQVLKNQRV